MLAKWFGKSYDCLVAPDAEQAMQVVRTTPDLALMITDFKMPGTSGLELMLSSTYDTAFADSKEIASWAKAPMYWAYYNGIISDGRRKARRIRDIFAGIQGNIRNG